MQKPTDVRTSASLPMFLSPQEIVLILGCARGKVYEMIASGVIPSIRIGRAIRVQREDFIKWVEASKVGGGTPAA